MAIKKGHTIVYENVQLNTSWVFSKNGSRVIRRKLELYLAPELLSKETIHIFDAKAGPSTYEITLVHGATQVVFSSTNRSSYAQFIRGSTYVAFLPSTSKEEFLQYVSLFGVSSEIVDEVVRVSGYGKIRPLMNLPNYVDRIENVFRNKNFDIHLLAASTSIENTNSGSLNPAILLDAIPRQDLDVDCQDLKAIYENYRQSNAVWKISCQYLIDRLCKQYGINAKDLVMQLYFAIGDDANRKFATLAGSLFENVAVEPDFIPHNGLECKSVDKYNGEYIEMTIGKECTLKDCRSDKVIPLDEILQTCKDPKVIYHFVGKNEGFDAFIPPNNFIGFTHILSRDDRKKGNHPISLRFALQCCNLIDGPVNYITAVPSHQTKHWGKQSFKVNEKEVVKKINEKIKNSKDWFNFGGQRTLNNLPKSTQITLKPFRQFVGSVVVKRQMCTVSRVGIGLSILTVSSCFK